MLWRRWRWAESKSNLQSGFLLTDEQWREEWDNVLKMADSTPRTSGRKYGFFIFCISSNIIFNFLATTGLVRVLRPMTKYTLAWRVFTCLHWHTY